MTGASTQRTPWRRRLLCALAASALLWTASVASEPLVLGEAQIKALFIVRFLSYVTWPSSAPTQSDKPFVVGSDDKQVATLLAEYTRDKKVDGRSVKIVLSEAERFDPAKFQVFYTGQTSPVLLESIVQKAHGRPVLTIAANPGAVARGAVINFVRFEQKVRFEVNYDELKASRLRMSSQLLRLALIVGRDR